MAAQVQILPSGHTFISEGRSSLLEAGLSAGLALSYGCSNGNCGQCLAKVVSGDVHKTRHHDFRIREHQKASGHVLMCCSSATGNVVIEAPEASNTSEIPSQQLTARVRNIQLVDNSVALVHLKTPRTSRLRFLAGQHVRLGGNGTPSADHSVGSCPCDDMNLHFQVPIRVGDAFSDHVFNSLKRGDLVDITGPGGEFVLNENSQRSLVFIAWRTGFSPIRSLIEHAMALDIAEFIQFVWIAPDKQDRYLDNLCRSWADAFDDFSYVPVDADLRDRNSDMHDSVLNQMFVRLGDLASYDYYIAGNDTLLNACRNTLVSAGLPDEQLKLDQLTHH